MSALACTLQVGPSWDPPHASEIMSEVEKLRMVDKLLKVKVPVTDLPKKGRPKGATDKSIQRAKSFLEELNAKAKSEEHVKSVLAGAAGAKNDGGAGTRNCLLYTSPSPRDQRGSRMPSSA